MELRPVSELNLNPGDQVQFQADDDILRYGTVTRVFKNKIWVRFEKFYGHSLYKGVELAAFSPFSADLTPEERREQEEEQQENFLPPAPQPPSLPAPTPEEEPEQKPESEPAEIIIPWEEAISLEQQGAKNPDVIPWFSMKIPIQPIKLANLDNDGLPKSLRELAPLLKNKKVPLNQLHQFWRQIKPLSRPIFPPTTRESLADSIISQLWMQPEKLSQLILQFRTFLLQNWPYCGEKENWFPWVSGRQSYIIQNLSKIVSLQISSKIQTAENILARDCRIFDYGFGLLQQQPLPLVGERNESNPCYLFCLSDLLGGYWLISPVSPDVYFSDAFATFLQGAIEKLSDEWLNQCCDFQEENEYELVR